MIDWIKKQKDILTTIAGVCAFLVAAINYVVNFVETGSGDWMQLVVGFILFVIGWFTGKKVAS